MGKTRILTSFKHLSGVMLELFASFEMSQVQISDVMNFVCVLLGKKKNGVC